MDASPEEIAKALKLLDATRRRNRESYHRNAERVLAKKKEQYAADPSKARAYYEAHKDEILAKVKARQEAKKGEILAAQRARQAAKRVAEGEGVASS